MKVTTIVYCNAYNTDGPITYRRITINLTPQQADQLRLHDRWDNYGVTFIELDPLDQVCYCKNASEYCRDSEGNCAFCGRPPPVAI